MNDTDSPAAKSLETLAAIPSQDKAPFRILLIDDNVDANESMALLLEMLGYEVCSALTGAAGIAEAERFSPNLILCDIGLPGMDGYEVVAKLRAQAAGRKVVIAAATGYGHESDRVRSHSAGFDHHLVKPIDADALIEFVARQAAGD